MPRNNAISSNNLKVLLVEDELLVQKIHLMMLQALNCDTTLAKTGQKALRYAANNKYDVIFMDIGLPDTSGIEITKRIRRNVNFKSNKSLIIALTAYVEDELYNDCIGAGVDMVEKKPISSIRLQQLCSIKKHQ